MPLKIFYLDDEQDLLDVFSDLFSDEDIVIATSSNPLEALAAIKKFQPDLIFLDYRLPNTTGDQFAKQLDISIPKILMTGDLTVQPESQFEQIISKPFNPDELKIILTKYLSKKNVA